LGSVASAAMVRAGNAMTATASIAMRIEAKD
jgi:diphthamide biosynthesis methyltransferase